MMDLLLDRILAETYNQTQALSRLRVLKDLVLLRLFGEKSQEEVPAPAVKPNQQTSWIVSLGSDIYKHFTRENVYKVFDELELEVKKIKPLVVYLPLDLPETETAELGQYLRKTYGKRFLMEVKLDPNLIAGVALVWNGVYKDYSVRKKITDNRQQILQMLGEYIKH